jgi:hypothetical protein
MSDKIRKLKAAGFSDELIAKMTKVKANTGSTAAAGAAGEVTEDSAMTDKIRKLKAAGFSDELIAKMTKGKSATGSTAAGGGGAAAAGSASGADSVSGKSESVSAKVSGAKHYYKEAFARLMGSYRNVNCEKFVLESKGQVSEECSVPKRGRLTAGPKTTSKRKIAFDIAQLQFIASKKSTPEQVRQEIHSVLSELRSLQSTVVAEKPAVVRTSAGRGVNGQLFLVDDKVDPFYTHQEGVDYGKNSVSLIGNDENDFVVLDGILLEFTRKAMISMLLSSTIWHDVASGQAFVAHSDDTLIYSAFLSLGKVGKSIP